MKLFVKSLLIFIWCFCLSSTSQLLANSPANLPDEKEVSSQKAKEVGNQLLNLSKSVDEKQAMAIRLINEVGSYSNERFSHEFDKEDAEFAYIGFIARFQVIKEDRESLERKEIMADSRTLLNYSQRLDQLIFDLQNFINK
jgi:hypothetical protein